MLPSTRVAKSLLLVPCWMISRTVERGTDGSKIYRRRFIFGECMLKKKNSIKIWNPGRFLELSGAYWETCVLHAAVKLDIFTVIRKKRLTSESVARHIGANEKAVLMLLNALSAMKLLTKKGESYSNTSAALSFLSKESAQYLGYIILHHHGLMASWQQLDRAVKSGKPIRAGIAQRNKEERKNFLLGMFNIAMTFAPRLVAKIDISGRKHLLDLGGGPGTYAIHFCMNNPGLAATVCDLPTTKAFAQETVKKFHLTDRIDFKAVDYLRDHIPGTYDVAWLSHILHGEGSQDCQKIVRKAVSVLKPGGMIIVHEFILNNTMDGPLFPALFSLNMLLGTNRGHAYSENQIKGMLIQAGVKKVRRIPFQSPNDSGIISGMV